MHKIESIQVEEVPTHLKDDEALLVIEIPQEITQEILKKSYSWEKFKAAVERSFWAHYHVGLPCLANNLFVVFEIGSGVGVVSRIIISRCMSDRIFCREITVITNAALTSFAYLKLSPMNGLIRFLKVTGPLRDAVSVEGMLYPYFSCLYGIAALSQAALLAKGMALTYGSMNTGSQQAEKYLGCSVDVCEDLKPINCVVYYLGAAIILGIHVQFTLSDLDDDLSYAEIISSLSLITSSVTFCHWVRKSYLLQARDVKLEKPRLGIFTGEFLSVTIVKIKQISRSILSRISFGFIG